jgi:hypothetical protein
MSISTSEERTRNYYRLRRLTTAAKLSEEEPTQRFSKRRDRYSVKIDDEEWQQPYLHRRGNNNGFEDISRDFSEILPKNHFGFVDFKKRRPNVLLCSSSQTFSPIKNFAKLR